MAVINPIIHGSGSGGGSAPTLTWYNVSTAGTAEFSKFADILSAVL